MRRSSIVGSIFFAVVMVLQLGAAPAKAVDALEPGLWRIINKTVRAGQETVQRTVTRCITPDEAKTFATNASVDVAQKGLACKSFSHHATDNGEILQLQCTGNIAFDATVTYTLESPQHYTVVFDAIAPLHQATVKSTLVFEGHRTGECSK